MNIPNFASSYQSGRGLESKLGQSGVYFLASIDIRYGINITTTKIDFIVTIYNVRNAMTNLQCRCT